VDDEAAAQGDPHMTNAAGKHFDLNKEMLNHHHTSMAQFKTTGEATGEECFVQGDGTSTAGEAQIGQAASKQECIDMVKAQPAEMGCTGATLPTAGSGACYCEKGWTGSNGSGAWITCGSLESVDDEAAAQGDPHMTNAAGKHFDLNKEMLNHHHTSMAQFKTTGEATGEECFVQGDGTSTAGEVVVGQAASKQECIDLVSAQPAEMGCTGATLPVAGSGSCYCEKGWTGSNGSGAWITCGSLESVDDEAAAQGDPHLTNAAGKHFDMNQQMLNRGPRHRRR